MTPDALERLPQDMRTFYLALRSIAHGRVDCGRPLAAERGRQIARQALLATGYGWSEAALAAHHNTNAAPSGARRED